MPEPETVLKIRKIIIKPCKNHTWQFEGEHEAGRVNYYGYPTVQEAVKAAAIWAIKAEAPVTIEFPAPNIAETAKMPGIPASQRTKPLFSVEQKVRHRAKGLEFRVNSREWSDEGHAWYYFGKTTCGTPCSAREDLLEACETEEKETG